MAVVLLLVLTGPASGASGGSTHTWQVTLTGPAQFDLTFAELRFKGSGTQTLRLSPTRSPGLYFVGAALVRRPVSGGPRVLLVILNRRPRGSLAPDRTSIGLGVTGASTLGAPVARQLANPFTRPGGRLCGLGKGHGPSDLRAALGAGRALPGFSTAAAVAEAYDVACGLPYDPAFKRAVTGCSTSFAAGCCPPDAMCVAPAPAPTPDADADADANADSDSDAGPAGLRLSGPSAVRGRIRVSAGRRQGVH